ncbi:hypothetical protein HDR59_02755 [bacterium]|nr:hypothetical protein [bacterium]
MQQLPLMLEHRRLLGREDFLVSPCNIEAVEWIDLYPEWYGNQGIVVVGDKSAGKTHLSWLFSEKSNAKVYNMSEIREEIFSDIVPINSALVIDDIDLGIGDYELEESLFHIINYAMECNTKLFFTTTVVLTSLDFQLIDLKTRLLSFPVATIYTPDDDLLKALLVKQFMERGIVVDADVVEYIIKHIERNASSVKYLVERADLLSVSEKKKITIPFIKKIIEEM